MFEIIQFSDIMFNYLLNIIIIIVLSIKNSANIIYYVDF